MRQSLFSLTGEMPLGTGEKIKETVVLSLLNVALPSVDVFSDLLLVVKFYIGSRINPYCDEKDGSYKDLLNCHYNDSVPTSNVIYTPHYGWGTLMLFPFLLNYLICWYVWATTDKKKAVTWVAVLLGFYSQYVACKVIWLIWTNPRKGLQKKRNLQRELSQIETFCEAVPCTLIMTYLMARTFSRAEGGEIIYNMNDLGSSLLFFVAYSTSVITSSLGLARNLKVGPCRILREQKKYLGGLLSPKFVLIFFACGLTLVGKGIALASAVNDSCVERDGLLAGRAAIALSTCFLPGFLVGLFACWHSRILKTLLAQPSVFLLPVFSYFTFVSNSKLSCKGGEGNERGAGREEEVERSRREEESFIMFSPKYTAINAGVSTGGLLLLFPVLSLVFPNQELCPSGLYLIYGGLPCTILSLLLTLVAAFSNQWNCCKSCCCCSSCSEPFEFGALLTSSPHTPYILGPEGELKAENIEESKNGGRTTDALKMGESGDNRGFLHSISNISSSTVGSESQLIEETAYTRDFLRSSSNISTSSVEYISGFLQSFS